MSDFLKELIKNGYFQSAIKYCKNKINNSNLEDKIHYENELKFIGKNYLEFINNSPGETYLPVVNKLNNKGRLLKIISSYSPENLLIKDEWKSEVSNIVKEILSRSFEQYSLPTLILEFDFDKVYCGIKKFNNIEEDYEIVGRSYLLPLVMSLLSLITGKIISNEICFSGDIESVAGNYYLKKVEGIEEKKEIIKSEFPVIKKFIYPTNTENLLLNLVEKIFGNEIIKSLTSPAIKSYFQLVTLKATSEFGEHKLVLLNNKKDILVGEDFARLAVFINKNKEIFKDDGRGVILDGRAPIIVYSFITSNPEIINTLKKFLALSYPPASSDNAIYNKTAIIIRTSNINSYFLQGQFLYYKI